MTGGEERLAWLARAAELDEQADQLQESYRALRREAAVLRDRAQRPPVEVPRKVPEHDPLLAAAGLASEELTQPFTSTQLAEALEVGAERAQVLLAMLVERELVRGRENGADRWWSQDPMEVHVRDAVIELGTFTVPALADKIQCAPEALTYYLAELRKARQITEVGPDLYEYERPGPERVITRRRKGATPEQQLAGERTARGEAIAYTGRPMRESGASQQRARQVKRAGGKTRKVKKTGYS